MTQIRDSSVLRAVAHPLRRQLLDLLRVDGPATPTVLARGSSQAVANVSHHLRVLAECGLVAEAPELARNRKERWWRIVDRRVQWTASDFTDDPASLAAADAAQSLGFQRQVELTRTWLGTPAAREQPWVDAAFSSDSWLRLTPAELDELGRRLIDLVGEYEDRPDDEDRETVFVLSRGFPARP